MNGMAFVKPLMSPEFRSMPLNFFNPAMIRAIVVGLSGFLRLKMLFPGSFQSMISRAALNFFVGPNRVTRPSGECVGSGHWIFLPSRLAITNSRSRVVGSP